MSDWEDLTMDEDLALQDDQEKSIDLDADLLSEPDRKSPEEDSALEDIQEPSWEAEDEEIAKKVISEAADTEETTAEEEAAEEPAAEKSWEEEASEEPEAENTWEEEEAAEEPVEEKSWDEEETPEESAAEKSWEEEEASEEPAAEKSWEEEEASEEPAAEKSWEEEEAPEESAAEKSWEEEKAPEELEAEETNGEEDLPEESEEEEASAEEEISEESEAEEGAFEQASSSGFTMRDPDPDPETIGSNFTMHSPDEDEENQNTGTQEEAFSEEEGKTVNTSGINKKGWSQRIQRRLPADPETEAQRRKRLAIALALAGVLALAVTAMVFFYNRALQKPADAVSHFLGAVKEMDFDEMASLLQDGDISALENADVTSPAYADFFRNVNGQMTYKIRSTSLNMGEGTARVTAHLRYVDGTDLYKAVVTEFLRDIVSSAFSGEALDDVNTQEKLAAMLAAKEAEMGLSFAETEITYPLVKTGGQWQVLSLDDQTVKIMSANFKNIEEEISSSLEESAAEAAGDRAVEGEGSAPDNSSDLVSFQSVVALSLDTDVFSIKYDSCQVAEDYAGGDCLLYYYVFTNKGSEPTSAMVNVNLQAYQNGEILEPAIPNQNDEAIDHYMAEVKPGESILVCQAFTLLDRSNVSVQARPSFSFDAEGASTQTLKLS